MQDDLISLIQPLTRAARAMTRNAPEAEDLVQEVLLRLHARAAHSPLPRPLRPYAMTALRNLRRDQMRRAAAPLAPLHDHDAAAPGLALPRLACAQTMAAIAALPADQAALLRLVAAGETSPKALAAQLNLPEGTVMSRLARARAALRRALDMAEKAPASSLWDG